VQFLCFVLLSASLVSHGLWSNSRLNPPKWARFQDHILTLHAERYLAVLCRTSRDHSLHSRELELSMWIIRIRRCFDHLHLHHEFVCLDKV
jgi:hypothetical protein